MFAVEVHGKPAPKGSMKPFIDAYGHARVHEDQPASQKAWRKLVTRAGERIATRASERAEEMTDGAVAVEIVVTLDPPATVKPADRPWPTRKSPGHGDVDKLARLILDAFTDSTLWTDDAQVCRLAITKCYPHTPGVIDRLNQSGAVIRVAPITTDPVVLSVYDIDGAEIRIVQSGVDQLELVVDGRVCVITAQAALRLARALEHEARYASAAEPVLL